jgi:ABC-type phosphate transport system substrate-binding protein
VKIKKAVALSTVIGVALAGLAFGGTASADPASNGYVAVGSDTLQDSMNALTNGTTVTGPSVRIVSNNVAIGNFDAFPVGSAIQTKPYGPYFGRPSGSSAGVNALRASAVGTRDWSASSNNTPAVKIGGQIDIARSSSGPGTNELPTTGVLYYAPYARDAVGYVYKGGSAAWANLDVDTLKGIFSGTVTSVGGITIKPRLPQTGSGTRNFFLGALYGDGVTTAAGVSDTSNTTAENDARVLGDGEIIPFSVASWVAQANGVAPINTTTTSGVSFGSAVVGQVAFTGTGSSLVPNPDYYSNTTFGRDTYLVVEWARIDPAAGNTRFDAGLAALVDPTNTAGLTNFSTTFNTQPGSVKKKFGFLAPSTTLGKRAYLAL